MQIACLWLALLLVAACGSPAPADENTSGITVRLLPPAEQAAGTLSVRLTTAGGQPITDATVRLEGDMTHAGMIPVISEPVEHDADTDDGIYHVPFEFTMLGDWIITAFVTTADGREIQTRIDLAVREDEVIIQTDQPGADASADGISIINAIARPAPLAGGNGAVYFTITNGTAQPVQFIGAETTVAAYTEIHESVEESGVMRMVHHPEGFTIPPGESLTLRPGGKHLMLVELTDPLTIGDTLEVTLFFDTVDDTVDAVTLSVPVAEPDDHAHQEHEHSQEHDHNHD